MRFIPTLAHGMLDYTVGVFLIAAPWLMRFADGGAETWVPVALGVGALAYSLCTDYELGFARRIPMGTHLALDFGSGLLLATSPWLFGFAEAVWMPHLALGLFEMGAALTTRKEPGIGTGYIERWVATQRARRALGDRGASGPIKPPSFGTVHTYRDADVEERRDYINDVLNKKSKEERRYEA